MVAKNPQKSAQDTLRKHLLAFNYPRAEAALSRGALINPESAEDQEKLWWAGAGPLGAPAQSRVAGWVWLKARGFDLGGLNQGRVYQKVLQSHPLVMADWLEEQWGALPTTPNALLAGAIKRLDTKGLTWLNDRGVSLNTTPPVYPSIRLALFEHRLTAGEHVDFLLDHGVLPAPDAAGVAGPLQAMAQVYHDCHTQQLDAAYGLDGLQRFKHLWERLVEAGEDPHQSRQGSWKTALGLTQGTPAQGMLTAIGRHDRASDLADTSPRCTPRIRV